MQLSKDIADVKLDFSEVPMKNYVNGKRGVSFIVKKTVDEDLIKLQTKCLPTFQNLIKSRKI